MHGTQTSMAVLVHQLMPMWYAFNVHVVCGHPLPIEALSQAKLVMKRVEIKTQKTLEVPETSLKKDLSGHEQQQIIANLKRGFKLSKEEMGVQKPCQIPRSGAADYPLSINLAMQRIEDCCTILHRKLQKGMATHHNPRRFTLFSIFVQRISQHIRNLGFSWVTPAARLASGCCW